MALIAAEDDLKQVRPSVARLLNWCIVIACIGFAFHIAINRHTGYFSENHGPQWLWDLYDWKTWPLSHFRQWRNSL